MRIMQIVPGSGGTFYCQNCMRDTDLLRTLRAQGHDVLIAPMYLPLFVDDPTLTRGAPVFYGAVRLYLTHRFPWLKRLPRAWLRRLDAMPLLRLAAKQEGSTSAVGLETMTLSMLEGEQGGQAGELEKLCDWLADEIKPDVIQLSSALLLGMARRLRATTGARLFCTLQDEDVWIDSMREPYRSRAWQLMSERAADIERFFVVSRHFAAIARDRMGLASERIVINPIGIDLTGYETAPLDFNPPTIGYLSRLGEKLGLGLLVDAFLELRRDPALRGLRLRATGGATPGDRAFLADIRGRIEHAGATGDVEIIESFTKPERIAFLKTLSVMSVPVPGGEAFGTHQLEAMAAGVPVVQPRAGGFTELVEATGGGLLYDPALPGAYTAALRALLCDPPLARRLGQAGQSVVRARYGIEHMAERYLAVYRGAPTAGGG